ncbi:MAG: ferric reductase-like transmembrane domain-containing protein [Paracoccaceae bacterium]
MARSGRPQSGGVLGNVYLFWLILALPAMAMGFAALVLHKRLPYFDWSGLLSCWLLVAAMAVTPLQLMFGPMPWLRVRRRYIGVASFGYAAIHLLFWLKSANWAKLIGSFSRVEVLTGWLAIAIMLIMAATSFDGAVKAMGPRWKTLQRWVYAGAILTLAHWVLTDKNWQLIAVSTVPLIAVQVWRIVRYRRRMRGA